MCTGIFIGKKVSLEGTRILARAEDQMTAVHPKRFLVKEASSRPGRSIRDTGKGWEGFSIPIPDQTCKYTLVPDISVLKEGDYCSVCINEYGLMISATMSLLNIPEAFLQLDPLTKEGSGIREANICEPVICQSRNCREAIKVLGGLLETYGAAESNAILLSDKEEAWIFENYGGSSWAAMRLPDDRAAVIGTLVMLEWFDPDDPGDDWYVSSNLKGLLDQMPSPVIREDGCYNITETMVPGKRDPFFALRIWRLQQRLCPSTVGSFNEDFHYPLLLVPDKKVSVLDVMKLLGDRFEGTEYDMDFLDWKDRKNRFPAGDSNQSATHIVQTFSDLPDRCCQLQWLAMANAEYSVFVPAFSGITDTFEKYKTDPEEDNLVDDSYYYLCKKIWGLAASDRERLGSGVSRFQRTQEKALLKQMLKEADRIREQYKISDAKGDRYVTELALRTAKDQYASQTRLFRRLFYHQISNYNEFQEDRKPFHMEPDTV